MVSISKRVHDVLSLYLLNEMVHDVLSLSNQADAQRFAFKKSKFDIVFCINAFEHIPNPEHALLEIHRALKSGGYAFISFIPVYYCDTGSHMIDFISEPWAHLRYNEEDYIRKLREASGGNEYFVNEFKHGLNRLSKGYFKDLFDKYSVDSNNEKNKLPMSLSLKLKSRLSKKIYRVLKYWNFTNGTVWRIMHTYNTKILNIFKRNIQRKIYYLEVCIFY